MNRVTFPFFAGALLCSLAFAAPNRAVAQAAPAADIDAFLAKDAVDHVEISPTGEYLAMTAPRESETGIVIMRLADRKVTVANFLGKNVHVNSFRWVSPTRLVFSVAETFGSLDLPQATGELMSLDAEKGGMELLVGFRVTDKGLNSKIKTKKVEAVYAYLVDDLPDDDRFVIISASPFSVDPQTRAERLDVTNGSRTTVARVPVRRARFTTDPTGVVRFAVGSGSDNSSKLYYRATRDAEWQLINDEKTSRRIEEPLGFSADGKLAYLQIQHPQGPDSIVAFDPADGGRKELLRDATVDPAAILTEFKGGSAPVGAMFMDAPARTAFFDKSAPEARLQRSLEASFPGRSVSVTSTTKDGKQALVQVWSADQPGEVYLFDTEKVAATFLFGKRDALLKRKLATMKPVRLQSRDGLALHGFLTLPAGSSGKQLPLVVLPHGGPIGIFDSWHFQDEAQILANAGYAVLQVNFRGSGNYGRAFMHAGAHEWGAKMQNDITDATRWAIQQGIVDPGRVCIYGASYGAYAAMMGAAREPALYRCAAGYVGVYDLEDVVEEFRDNSGSAGTYAQEWIGHGPMLRERSPTQLAGQIKVPVFLAAGKEDKVAPIKHSEKMEAALKKAGVPVETLYVAGEGHGFYVKANRRRYYEQLLAFLGRHLGPATAQ